MELINEAIKQIKPTHLFGRWLIGLAVIIVLILACADLAEDVWLQEGFSWDAPTIVAIHQLGNPLMDNAMRFVTLTGEAGALLIAFLLAGWFVSKHRHIDALTVITALGGAMTINFLLKLVFARPRPNLFPPLIPDSGFSFPSGHVTASVAVYGFLAVLLWQNNRRGWALLPALWVLLVAISRIYLGLHYPSDTIAAITFTSLWMFVIFFARSTYLSTTKAPTS